MIDNFKHRLDELVKQYKTYGGSLVGKPSLALAEELHAEVERLKDADLVRQWEYEQNCKLTAAIYQLRTAADKMKEALAAHRRFHGKVGCPDDCYACMADEESYPYEQAIGGQ